MKKLVFAIAALAALSLLAPTSGFAQLDLTANNQIGIYADAEASAAHVMGVDNLATVMGYLVLTNPYDDDGGMPAASVGGFEVGVTVPATCVLTASTFPNADALNVGTNDNMIVGFGTPRQVIDGKLHVATLSFLYVGGGAPATISLNPTDPASVPGTMAFLAGAAGLTSAYPSSGDYANPVFGINTDAIVATEMTSMDNIKAMYR